MRGKPRPLQRQTQQQRETAPFSMPNGWPMSTQLLRSECCWWRMRGLESYVMHRKKPTATRVEGDSMREEELGVVAAQGGAGWQRV